MHQERYRIYLLRTVYDTHYMSIVASSLHLYLLSVAVLAGLIAILGVEIIVSQRNKKLVPARIKPEADPKNERQPQRRGNLTTR